MHGIVVVEVVPQVLESNLTIIVISMVSFGYWLIQPSIKEAKKIPAIWGPVIQQNHDHAEVKEQEHRQDSPEPLARIEDVDRIRPQVRPSAQDHEASYQSSPPILFINCLSVFRFGKERILLLVVVIESCLPNVAHDDNKQQLDVIWHIRH